MFLDSNFQHFTFSRIKCLLLVFLPLSLLIFSFIIDYIFIETII